MIHRLQVSSPASACTPWWPKVEWLQGRETIEFQPGLTILWGPNGSGKSTVLRAIARALHCEQGGTQMVTDTSFREMYDGGSDAMRNSVKQDGYRDGVMPVHDGQRICYFDPGATVGLIGGSFDYDFMDQGLMNTTFKGSAGQTTMMRGQTAMMAALKGGAIPEPKWKKLRATERPDGKDDWRMRAWNRSEQIAKTLAGTEPDTGITTVLLDEPDRSLDVPIQARFWLRLAVIAMERKIQIIAASHSIFALGLPGANYIEFREGYHEQSMRSLREHTSFMEMMAKTEAEKAAEPDPEPLARDPRTDPIIGDVVRIPWPGGTQVRRVTGIFQHRGGPKLGPEYGVKSLHWDLGDLTGGSKISVASWRKLTKDGEVLQRGEGTGVLTWVRGAENPLRETRLAETSFKWKYPKDAVAGTSISTPPYVELAERDPLTDPVVGDVVRIPWGKGGTQERQVRKVTHMRPDLAHRAGNSQDRNVNIYWLTPDRVQGTGKRRGSKVSLRSWRKLARGGAVIARGEGSKAVVWETSVYVAVEAPGDLSRAPQRSLPGTIASAPPFNILLDRDGEPVRHEGW